MPSHLLHARQESPKAPKRDEAADRDGGTADRDADLDTWWE